MNPDILIVRDGEGYRLLHGYLHLASQLTEAGEVVVETRDEGRIKVVKTRSGPRVERNGRCLPLRED